MVFSFRAVLAVVRPYRQAEQLAISRLTLPAQLLGRKNVEAI